MSAPDLGSLVFRTRDDEGEIRVHEDDRCRYLTFGNEVEQSCVELARPARLAYVYTQAMMLALLLHPQPRSALLLGVGGGSLLRALRAAARGLRITGIERRAAVLDVARAWFGLPEDRRVQLVCDEADAYLRNTSDRFDLLFADLYHADGMYPEQLAAEFLASCRMCLEADGVLVVNQWASELDRHGALLGNLGEVFGGQVLHLHVQGGNILSFAFNGALPKIDRGIWLDAAQALGQRLDIPLQRQARNLWRQNAEVLRVARYRR
ncbi:MAG: methyltransferase domain-containing protein [Gammaproteobacteria bacterium]|nr:methyltransferase domain-containing protein [Gammaproteobacteria bacterium]